MKIFLSYGHDDNSVLVEHIREYLISHEEKGFNHEVWIDKSDIKQGNDWRERITEGIMNSDLVLAGLSKYSTRDPGVCRDEISISIGTLGGNVKTILLEPSQEVSPPAMLSHVQWIDMSDWKDHKNEGFDSPYFQEKFKIIASVVDTTDNQNYNDEITRLKKLLAPISSLNRLKTLAKEKMYGRQWLYKAIENWSENSEQRIFWIMAGAGFGKSVFAANLHIKYCDRIPAIQFVEWGKSDHTDACSILRNLAFQLAVRYPDYRKFIFDREYERNGLYYFSLNEHELFDRLFCENTWMKIDGGHEQVWILVDALDEANEEYGNKIAQTIARHIRRMPKWIRFIITSRDDTRVSMPLQEFQPQVFDLESTTREQNNNDISDYLRQELREFSPTDDQIECIVNRSQGAFIYANRVVEAIRRNDYSLDNLECIPSGMDAFNFEMFNRIFQDKMSEYRQYFRPILQTLASALQSMDLPLLMERSGISSETTFYDCLDVMQQLIRIYDDKAFFYHQSVKDWITDKKKAGPYFVSVKDGKKDNCMAFINWACGSDGSMDSYWIKYKLGLRGCTEQKLTFGPKLNKDRAVCVFQSLLPSYGNGICDFANWLEPYLTDLFDYFKMLVQTGKEQDILVFLDRVVEGMEIYKQKGYNKGKPTDLMELNKYVKCLLVMGTVGSYITRHSEDFCKPVIDAFIKAISLCCGNCRQISEDVSNISRAFEDYTEHVYDQQMQIRSKLMSIVSDTHSRS